MLANPLIMTPSLAKIRIYPIKSLDALELDQVEIGTHSLKGDREFAMITPDGNFFNGKRSGLVNQLNAEYDLKSRGVLFSRRGQAQTRFHLDEDREAINEYLSDFFSAKITLLQNNAGDLMDIPKVSSVTLLSEASLQSLQSDMQEYPVDELRLRFRANLEISGFPPFGEEQLFYDASHAVEFQIGEVTMFGISPRARCNVPPRNPYTGEPSTGFVKQMMESRRKSLPNDSRLPEFGGMYHLTVNVFVDETQAGKKLKIGDPLTILGPRAIAR